MAKLEGGAGSVVTSSGMAAIDLVLAKLSPKQLVIAPHDCYGGTYRLLAARAAKGQFELLFIDQNDDEGLVAALKKALADAVGFEPVSKFKFPKNREKYRENGRSGLKIMPRPSTNPASMRVSSENTL